MASNVNHFYSLFAFVTVSSLLSSCSMAQQGGFSPTVATWFGNANGAGSDGMRERVIILYIQRNYTDFLCRISVTCCHIVVCV